MLIKNPADDKKPADDEKPVNKQCLEDEIQDMQLIAYLLRPTIEFYKCKNKCITSIHGCTFLDDRCSNHSKYPKLKGLSLDNNNIKELHEQTFMALTNVTFIVLHNNEIVNLPKYLFKYNIKLTNINLNNNHLTNISIHLFINNTKLKKIQLLNNKIKHFIIECKYLRDLTLLYLHGNPLLSLDEDTFMSLLSPHYYNNLKITFDTSSFTCYSMLCNMSWLLRDYPSYNILGVSFRNLTNSILIYKDIKGLSSLHSRNLNPTFNDDFYSYMYKKIRKCNIHGLCSLR